MGSPAMQTPDSLLTRDFVVLNAVTFLSFCNLAVFFQFYQYLGTLPIDPKWFGFIIGIFSFMVLILRPVISPFIHAGNARNLMIAGCALVIPSLLLYNVGHELWSMVLIRIIHGIGYVVLATASTAALVACIPQERSGQAFGLITVVTLLPYAVIPPLLQPLASKLGGFDQTLDLFAGLMVLAFPMLIWGGAGRGTTHQGHGERLRWADLVEDLHNFNVCRLLVVSLIVWTAFTAVFYFVKGYGQQIGIANPGWFFTLSTFAEISVRLVAGSYFDKLDKGRLLVGSMVWLVAGYVLLASVPAAVAFYGLGVLLGLGWGVAMPVISGLVFDISPIKFRALNINLTFEMFQGGFFLGPVLGGALLLTGGYSAVFYFCGGISLLAVAAAIPLIAARRKK